jgi:hypothetical protein
MKKVSFWAVRAASLAFAGLRHSAEMFGQLCRLQTLSFFSIGHSFAALAFVVSALRKPFARKKLAEGSALHKSQMCRCSSNLSVRTA